MAWKVTPEGVWAFIRNVAASITAIGAAVILLWNFGVWLFEPRVKPYLETIDTIPTIISRLDNIDERLPMIQRIVRFVGAAYATPDRAIAGQRISFTYQVSSIEECPREIEERWLNFETGGYESRYSRIRPSAGSPVSEVASIVTVQIEVPDLRPGVYAYAPLVRPGPECQNRIPIPAPLAQFTVIPTPEGGSPQP